VGELNSAKKYLEITEIPLAALGEYARIPSPSRCARSFELDLPSAAWRDRLREQPVTPYINELRQATFPADLAPKFDMKTGAFPAVDKEGAPWAAPSLSGHPGVDMLAGRRDLAVLWDLRVLPRASRAGLGGRSPRPWPGARAWLSQLKIENAEHQRAPPAAFTRRRRAVGRRASLCLLRHPPWRTRPSELGFDD